MTQPLRIAPSDPEIAEEWIRETAEPDVGNVGASRWAEASEWPWRVWAAAAEFLRNDPLEARFRRRMGDELRRVAGVRAVSEEDREVWLVSGEPNGAALTRAAAVVVDELEEEIRDELRRT